MEKKCVCGYEYEDEYVKESGKYITKKVKGDKEFIKIEGHFTITKSYHYEPDQTRKVNLHACPKCNTIQMEEIW